MGNELEAISERETATFHLVFFLPIFWVGQFFFVEISPNKLHLFFNLVGEKIRAVLDVGRKLY